MPIVKRLPDTAKENYVVFENGETVLRTPRDTTYWDHNFRLRIIRDYIGPNTLVSSVKLHTLYDPAIIYKIQGKKVRFIQPYEPIQDMRDMVLVSATKVIDIAARKAMILVHPDGAMRVLMVYRFLTGKLLGGVAPYDTEDWQP